MPRRAVRPRWASVSLAVQWVGKHSALEISAQSPASGKRSTEDAVKLTSEENGIRACHAGAIRGRAAPLADSGVSTSKTAPTLRPHFWGLPPPLSARFARPPPFQRVSPLQGLSPQPCAPHSPPRPDSFRPRSPICWEEPPTLHLSSYFLTLIPSSAAVPSSRKTILIERRSEPTLRVTCPPAQLSQAAGYVCVRVSKGEGRCPLPWANNPQCQDQPRARVLELMRELAVSFRSVGKPC